MGMAIHVRVKIEITDNIININLSLLSLHLKLLNFNAINLISATNNSEKTTIITDNTHGLVRNNQFSLAKINGKEANKIALAGVGKPMN